MKRFTALLLIVFSVFLFGCNSDNENESSVATIVVSSYTQKFYTDMNKNSFYFKMNFTHDGETCIFEQATNGNVCTSIKDYVDDTKDTYDIFNGTQIDHVNVEEKRIDTSVSQNGQKFIFQGYSASSFASPVSSSEQEFKGNKYYCETFKTVDAEGNGAGEDRYYFDGERLVAVEILSGGKVTMVMEFIDYSNTIPETILLSVPDDYKKGEVEFEVSVDFSGWFDD